MGFLLSFIMVYIENTGLRDCSGFLQIGSQMHTALRGEPENACTQFICGQLQNAKISTLNTVSHIKPRDIVE